MNDVLRIFIGVDPRQPPSLMVLMYSIISRCSKPVSITPLVIEQLPMSRTGLTDFTWSRFLVPYLCDFKGPALFMDADMLVLGDMAELFALADESKAVQVAKHTEPFERAAIMLFNCGHVANRVLTPEFIDNTKLALHATQWCDESVVGEIPKEWAYTVFYEKDDCEYDGRPAWGGAKLVHYTSGNPFFPETKGCPYSEEWHADARACMSAHSWREIMGPSVHAPRVKKFLERNGRLREIVKGQAA